MPRLSEPLRIVAGNELALPDEQLARMVARGRGSLRMILGNDACRYRLLHQSINWDRLLFAFHGNEAVGHASFKHGGRGPFSPPGQAFVDEFGRCRGWLRFALYRFTEYRERHHAFFLYGLRVGKEHRRQGIATALIEAVCAQARALGADTVALEVLGRNRGARQLYRRNGFHLASRLPLPGLHVLGMRRRLAP
ncbi:GNAT family N-acetyltransferase [Pseudomonas eucalypticola]|uniref:GNAT family N-acetyltransferase n=1 Tax=Pseudomonas eucalypticola TaxID=2599595 RepID=A0A7D5D9I8_9PSED|nr:GNAT family N-acetyltransferase [Pseudomonas eucalypticola]QKZ06097.1 GNAT family N-acetyltransferase [Pseudomonas eucalypticola]